MLTFTDDGARCHIATIFGERVIHAAMSSGRNVLVTIELCEQLPSPTQQPQFNCCYYTLSDTGHASLHNTWSLALSDVAAVAVSDNGNHIAVVGDGALCTLQVSDGTLWSAQIDDSARCISWHPASAVFAVAGNTLRLYDICCTSLSFVIGDLCVTEVDVVRALGVTGAACSLSWRPSVVTTSTAGSVTNTDSDIVVASAHGCLLVRWAGRGLNGKHIVDWLLMTQQLRAAYRLCRAGGAANMFDSCVQVMRALLQRAEEDLHSWKDSLLVLLSECIAAANTTTRRGTCVQLQRRAWRLALRNEMLEDALQMARLLPSSKTQEIGSWARKRDGAFAQTLMSDSVSVARLTSPRSDIDADEHSATKDHLLSSVLQAVAEGDTRALETLSGKYREDLTTALRELTCTQQIGQQMGVLRTLSSS
eukprot:TRINITY_DN910_c0_g1_i1.p1 TRINITY_DN910_c0_g1~~TRINITY_DN910_c0_g1_i1.p1  ORF type:complete len:421 (-),score=97.24 TRINITY_DN910_c0_g1_i1:642-1904(-)